MGEVEFTEKEENTGAEVFKAGEASGVGDVMFEVVEQAWQVASEHTGHLLHRSQPAPGDLGPASQARLVRRFKW